MCHQDIQDPQLEDCLTGNVLGHDGGDQGLVSPAGRLLKHIICRYTQCTLPTMHGCSQVGKRVGSGKIFMTRVCLSNPCYAVSSNPCTNINSKSLPQLNRCPVIPGSHSPVGRSVASARLARLSIRRFTHSI
jgi:hypothetical protein